MQTLKIIGLLLSYPEKRDSAANVTCARLLRQEDWLAAATQEKVVQLLRSQQDEDLLDLQEAYTDLFDRTPSLSLHLFEHVHGDSRDRGQAMVDLLELYKQSGLAATSDELPDYLPLFLEFLSTLPPETAREHLDSAVNVIAAIGERLNRRHSPYAVLFDALVEMASRVPDADQLLLALQQASGAPTAAAELDATWEEQFAFVNTAQTTGISDGCPKAQAMLANIEERFGAEQEAKI
jgi:nitrate reductase molybdenum cofactor assembly chaperone NarJ/NarW